MKLSLHLSLLFALFFSTFIPMHAQDTTAVEEFIVLKIGGEITYKAEKMSGVLVELYEQNRMVDAMETKKNGKFKFALYNNHIYTIQISKDGYFTKKIEVNTTVPNEFEDEVEYPFDMELEEYVANVSPKTEDLLEYPIALIAYDKKEQGFKYHKEYTKGLIEELKSSSSTQ